MRPCGDRGDAPPGPGLYSNNVRSFARRCAMRRFWKWCGVPSVLAGALLLLAADDGQGQQIQFRQGPGGGGPPGGGMDPDQIWNMMSRGQDKINLNDPANAMMKQMRERRGQPIPPDGMLTRDMFKAEQQQRIAQGGG